MEHDLWLLVTSPAILQRLWFSLWLSVLVVLGSLALGGGLALWEHWRRAATTRWFLALCAITLFLPAPIVGTGLIQLLGRSGDLNTLLTNVGLSSVQFLYTPLAVVLAHLYYNIPLAYLAIKLALDQISRHTEETALIMGANCWARWRTMLWPQIQAAVLGVSALIFLYNLTSFILPLLLGGIHAQTLEVWLYQQIYLHHNYTSAYIIAGLQTILLSLVSLILWRQPATLNQSVIPVSGQKKSGSWQLLRWLLAGWLLAPLVSLIGHTLPVLSWPVIGQLIQTDFFIALGRTTLLALAVVLVASGLVLWWRGGFTWLILLLTLSPVTLGFIWLLIFGKGHLSFSLALLSSVLPIMSYFITQAFNQRPRYFLETARCLGANPWQQRRLELSYMRPAIQRAVAVGLTIVLSDVALANLLAPYHSPTAMQLALGFVSTYHFALGGVAMVILLFYISTLQLLLLYARR